MKRATCVGPFRGARLSPSYPMLRHRGCGPDPRSTHDPGRSSLFDFLDPFFPKSVSSSPMAMHQHARRDRPSSMHVYCRAEPMTSTGRRRAHGDARPDARGPGRDAASPRSSTSHACRTSRPDPRTRANIVDGIPGRFGIGTPLEATPPKGSCAMASETRRCVPHRDHRRGGVLQRPWTRRFEQVHELGHPWHQPSARGRP